MKNSLLVLFTVLSTSVFAQQTVYEKFQKITTKEQAQQYIDANPALKPIIFNVASGKDSTVIGKRLLRQNKGDVFSVGYVTYKVLDATEVIAFRASYIFLDGATYSNSQIDSLKKLITAKANSGTPWDKLSDEYTMDGNTTHGDTGWFFGEEMMPKEFQDAVKLRKLGDIFYVDVADRNWHYIVKKTYDDSDKKEMTVLRSNGR